MHNKNTNIKRKLPINECTENYVNDMYSVDYSCGVYYNLFDKFSSKIRIEGEFDLEAVYKYMEEKCDNIYVSNKYVLTSNGLEKNNGAENEKNSDNTYVFILKKEEILLNVSSNNGCLCIYFSNDYPDTFIEEFTNPKYHKSVDKNNLSVVIPSQEGLITHEKELKRTNFIPENYNEDFISKHELIIQNLSENKSGLYLFHGLPGTGKSSYIASLTSNENIKKKFIYLPSIFISSLDSPDLIKLFLENDNSIFIIEDAEKLLVSRDTDSYSPISALLNLTDGLLGQILNTQIICTYNTEKNKIDNALMRKGRLICTHDFTKLTIDRAKMLVTKLNKNIEVKEEMTLAEIYNYETDNFNEINITSKIGFKS